MITETLFGGRQPRIDVAERQSGANDSRPLGDAERERHPGYEGGYYGGDDRHRQVNALLDMAANITFGSDDASCPVEERVAYFLENEPDLPAWFDAHDRELLARFVGECEA